MMLVIFSELGNPKKLGKMTQNASSPKWTARWNNRGTGYWFSRRFLPFGHPAVHLLSTGSFSLETYSKLLPVLWEHYEHVKWDPKVSNLPLEARTMPIGGLDLFNARSAIWVANSFQIGCPPFGSNGNIRMTLFEGLWGSRAFTKLPKLVTLVKGIENLEFGRSLYTNRKNDLFSWVFSVAQ